MVGFMKFVMTHITTARTIGPTEKKSAMLPVSSKSAGLKRLSPRTPMPAAAIRAVEAGRRP